MHINPTPEQQQEFMALPEGEPVFMINLLKFKPDGLQTYQTYIKAVIPIAEEVGGTLIWSGKPLTTLIGPVDEMLWDAVLIMRYPDKMALMKLGGHPNYPGHLRADALEDSRLIACSAFNLI